MQEFAVATANASSSTEAGPSAPVRPGLLCISTFEKRRAFCARRGGSPCAVKLLTVHKLANADCPNDVPAGFETLPEDLTPEQVLPYVERMAKRWRF